MLLDPFLANAARTPEKIGVVDDRGSYTNATLARMAGGIAALVTASTTKNAVGLLLPSCAAFVGGFYGATWAGKTVVPINFLLGPREIGHIVADSGIDLILSAPPLAEKIQIPGVKVIDLAQLPTDGNIQPPAPAKAQAGDLATILYTSGTSGLPKGVELTHANLDADVRAAIVHAELKGEHNFLGIVPLFHSTGLLATMLAPVTLGAKAVYIARFSPVATIKAIREHAISVMAGVPSMYGAICRLKDAGPDDFKQMYATISGGEPLPATIREAFRAKFDTRLMEGYGLTETIGPVAFNTPQNYRAGSVGKVMAAAKVKFVDDNDNEVPPGGTGEILLAGPMIFRRYHNLPEETKKAKTPDGYFRSGDIGHLDADGYLHITGRKKDLIIVSGEKVPPREIEELLGEHPAIADVAVVGRPDESRGEMVVAFVVPKPDQTVDAGSVREFLKAKNVMQWKIPKAVHVVADLPRSPTGKVLKRELKEPA